MPRIDVIDVSHYNTVTSWAAVKASGVVGAIFKATEGVGYEDPSLKSGFADALKSGLACCTYHYLHHGNADGQMDYYLGVIDPQDGERVIIDYEHDDCTLDDLHEAVQRLLDFGHDLQITVYSGHLLKDQLGNSRDEFLEANTDLWVAQYTTGSPSWPSGTYKIYSLWQWSDQGSIDGVQGDVDKNEFNGSKENCVKWIGPASQQPAPSPDVAQVDIQIDTTGDVTVTVNGKRIT
jgi:lysozyme